MAASKAGRNDLCPCGSGKKYKKCHGPKDEKSRGTMIMLLIVGVLIVAGVAFGISSFTTKPDVARPSGVWSPEHGHYH